MSTYMAGPFLVETIGENPWLCGYKVTLPGTDKVYEFKNGRELSEWFEACCAPSPPAAPISSGEREGEKR